MVHGVRRKVPSSHDRCEELQWIQGDRGPGTPPPARQTKTKYAPSKQELEVGHLDPKTCLISLLTRINFHNSQLLAETEVDPWVRQS